MVLLPYYSKSNFITLVVHFIIFFDELFTYQIKLKITIMKMHHEQNKCMITKRTKPTRKIYDSNSCIQRGITKFNSNDNDQIIHVDRDRYIVDRTNQPNCSFDIMISKDIYLFILRLYLTDEDHISLCSSNQHKYQYWSKITSLKETYNENVFYLLIKYKQTWCRSI
jgi:hypothetical protein